MKLKSIMSFTITPKKMNHLDKYLSKHVQDLQDENYKMLIKKLRVYLDKLRYILLIDWKIQHSSYCFPQIDP